MVKHHFLLEPGIWLGEGKVAVVSHDNEIKFYTRWRVEEKRGGKIIAVQEVELAKGEDKTVNTFMLSQINDENFLMQLQNDLFGQVFGKGIINDKSIAWEFHGKDLAFEGFEVCQLQEDESYLTRAEYTSTGEPHTVIIGKLWKKESKKP